MTNHHTEKQVDTTHYQFDRYSGLDRWVSYHSQLHEALRLVPTSVLEIGVGDRVFGNYLISNTGIRYESADIDPELHPTHVAPITALPIADASFDLAVAFEVLEHIPFENFELALGELARVSKKYVVISIPHFGPPIQLHVKIPFLRSFQFAVKIPFPKKHEWNGEHYWEVGKKGYDPSTVRRKIEKIFKIQKEFVPYGNQYHRFYVLEKLA